MLSFFKTLEKSLRKSPRASVFMFTDTREVTRSRCADTPLAGGGDGYTTQSTQFNACSARVDTSSAGKVTPLSGDTHGVLSLIVGLIGDVKVDEEINKSLA
jgi:hypothetical protein